MIKSMIKSMKPSNRFSLVCAVLVVLACIASLIITLILLLNNDLRKGSLAIANTVVSIPASFIYLLLFILPGLLISEQLVKRDLIKRKYSLLSSVSLSAVLSYVVFWVYVANHIAGRVTSVVIILACIVLFFIRIKTLREYICDPFFIKPLTIMFIVGCFYSAIMLLYHSLSADVSAIANTRFTTNLPSDNIIPRWVMDMAYNGQPLAMLDHYWYVTERPPLVVAIKLLLFPINIFKGNVSAFHQFFGTYLQLLWIPALYYILEFFSFSGRVRVITLSCAVFSGFFLINSVFVWPKLITTIFFCLVFVFVFELADIKKNTKKAAVYAIMIGIATAMAILSHGVAMFSFFALGIAILAGEKRFNYNYRDLLYVFGAFIALYIPWHLLGSYYNEAGNRLLQMVFSGYEINHPTLAGSMFIYYTETPIEAMYAEKAANIFRMFDFNVWHYADLEYMRQFAFNQVFSGAGILNIFLFAGILYFLNRFCFNKEKLSYKHRTLLWFTILSFSIWPLMMSIATVAYQGSYFKVLILYLMFAYGIKHTNKFIKVPVFVGNMLVFISAFIFFRDISIGDSFINMNYSMLVMMLLSAAAFFVYLFRYDDEKEPAALNMEVRI